MENLIGWLILGGIIGFLYAKRKTKAAFERSKQILDDIPDESKEDRVSKAQARGYQLGLRGTALAISTAVGSIIGGLIWGLASLLVFFTS